MYKSYGVLIGFLIAIMVTINGTLAGYVGDYTATVVIHFVGLILVIMVLFTKKLKLKINKEVPFLYYIGGGTIGAIMTVFNNMCFSALGVSLTLALGLVGQLVASAVIDHYGLFGLDVSKFNKEKILGFIIIAVGITIMVIY